MKNADAFKLFEDIKKRNIADPAWLATERKRLSAYMTSHPRRAARRIGLIRYLFRAMPALLVILTLALTGAGVSFASQDSLPGETLFPVKVGLENIELAFITSSAGRAEFAVLRTAKRLHEVTELAVKKPNDTKSVATAHALLQAQVKEASLEIAKTAVDHPQEALQVAVELSATLQAHKDVLNQIAPQVGDEVKLQVADALSAIASTSKGVSESIKDLKTQSDNDIAKAKDEDTAKDDSIAKLKDASAKADTTWNLVVALDEGSKTRIEAEIDMQAAQEALTEAQASIDAEAYGDATLSIQAAMQIIAKTQATLDATQKSGTTVKGIVASPTATPTPSSTLIPSVVPKASVSLDML